MPITAQETVPIIAKLNKALARLSVPVPPLAEQRRIVEAVERILEKLDDASIRLEHAATILGFKLVPARGFSLAQAVLAKAFRGELVPTEADLAEQEGRVYEPASELLARLKGSRNNDTKRGRGRRPSKRDTDSDKNSVELMEG